MRCFFLKKSPKNFSFLTVIQNLKSRYGTIISNTIVITKNAIEKPVKITKPLSILEIDTCCGTPILEMRSKLKEYGITHITSYGFTTNAKYYLDLKTICQHVACDRIDFLCDYYGSEKFGCILLGEPINHYAKPFLVVKHLYQFLKLNGSLLFKLSNTLNIDRILYSLGRLEGISREELSLDITPEVARDSLLERDAKNLKIVLMQQAFDEASMDVFRQVINTANQRGEKEVALARLLTKEYLFLHIK